MARKRKNEMIRSELAALSEGSEDIREIDIIDENGSRCVFIAPPYDTNDPLQLPSSEFIGSLKNMRLSISDNSIADSEGHPYLVIGRNTVLGYILLYIDEAAFCKTYETENLKNSTLYLSNNDRIISSTEKDFIGMKPDFPLRILYTGLNGNAVKYYSFTTSVLPSGNDLTLSYLLSNSDLKALTNRVNRIIFIILSTAAVVLIFAVLILSNRLIGSINRLRKSLSLFSEDVRHNFTADPDSEIAELEDQFARMSNRIRSQIDTINTEKEAKRAAELKALQAQINPHFIYNSIDAISWMAKLKKPYDSIEKLSYNLGQFFRLGLHKGENLITIGEEIQHVKSYLEIEKICYPDRFDVEIDAEEALLPCRVIKIILQPVVENAIQHGFDGIRYKGLISIRIYTARFDRDYVIFSIHDNGVGYDQEDGALPASHKSGGGYALKNIYDRLELEYGSDAGIDFESRSGCGTTVSIRILKERLLPEESQA